MPEDSPFEKISQGPLSDMLDDESTFRLYDGAVPNDDHNEILCDVKKLDGSEIVTEKEGTETNEKMLNAFNAVLVDYNLTVNDQTYDAGEKRIYALTFFRAEEGKAVSMTAGISDLQEDDLNEDILTDEKQQLDAFFSGTPPAG